MSRGGKTMKNVVLGSYFGSGRGREFKEGSLSCGFIRRGRCSEIVGVEVKGSGNNKEGRDLGKMLK